MQVYELNDALDISNEVLGDLNALAYLVKYAINDNELHPKIKSDISFFITSNLLDISEALENYVEKDRKSHKEQRINS